jgi:hypothetical protein
MSETNTQDRPRNRKQDAVESAPSASAPVANTALAQALADAAIKPEGFATIEIDGMDVSVPRKFAAGMVLTDTQAKILDAAYQRQFVNNQNAMAKGRSDRRAAGKDTAENAPWTAEQYVEAYATYEPNVGRERMGGIEKLRRDAARTAFTKLANEHNAALAAGTKSPVKGRTAPMVLPAGKGSAEVWEKVINGFLVMPAYADRIQAELDILLAAKAAEKSAPKTKAEKVDAGDLLGSL